VTQVSLSHLTKQYSSQPPAVDDLTLEIPAGKLTALLGPSGCGKTTILKLIAGLAPLSAGDIYFDGDSVLDLPAERRGAVMVFQNHLLFPYLSVGENVAFGLKMRREDKNSIQAKVASMLELVQLGGYEKRRPAQLSGGQQQRVALARALVVQPRVLLLDEPLSSLDANLRDEMRELIRDLQRQQEITTVFVTHDQEEAVMLADQIALILEGKLQQAAAPPVFFEQPANLETARFFGASNILLGAVNGEGIETGLGRLQVERNHLPPGPVSLAIRPENIQILQDGQGRVNTIAGRVRSCSFLGTRSRLKVATATEVLDVVTETAATWRYQEGDPVLLFFPPEKLWAYA